jgi:hypothetical protein
MSRYRLIRSRDELVVVKEHRDYRVGSICIRYEVRDNQAEPIAVPAHWMRLSLRWRPVERQIRNRASLHNPGGKSLRDLQHRT